jgi:hypothetical protein
MGQEYSAICPVCKKNDAVYRDIFKAECFDIETYQKYENKFPPFEKFLGPNCIKYLSQRIDFMTGNVSPDWYRKDNYVSWTFLSCGECIFIDDIDRNEKFSEYNPSGIKMFSTSLN